MEIICEKKKEIILRNEIKIDDVLVVGQSITINSNDPEKLIRSSWTNNEQLYKENRLDIRKMMFDFEDEAYLEQEGMLGESK